MVGIDEAGRGSLAGSMFWVGIQTPSKKHLENIINLGLRDSKKMKPYQRERIYEYVKSYKNEFNYIVQRIPPKAIDELGLSICYGIALDNIYNRFKDIDNEIIFDGNTTYSATAPIQTVIKAEDKFIEVALASVLAKVLRDKEIQKFKEMYPEYLWEKHNGYSQKIHKEMIQKYGRIPGVHRFSWKI